MKKVLFASIGLLSLVTMSATYANEVKTSLNDTGFEIKKDFKQEVKTAKDGYKQEVKSLAQQIKTHNERMEENRKDFHTNFLYARKYLIKPLTGEQRLAVNNIIKVKDDAMKALQKSTNVLIKSGTVNRTGYITQATNIITGFRLSMLPYVATGQITGFDTFIQSKINFMISNMAIREANYNLKMDLGDKKITFKERLNQKRSEYKDLINSMKKGK